MKKRKTNNILHNNNYIYIHQIVTNISLTFLFFILNCLHRL